MPKSVCESTFYAFIDKIYCLILSGLHAFWWGHLFSFSYSSERLIWKERKQCACVFLLTSIFFFLDVVSVWWILLTVSLSFSLHLSAQFDMFEASDSVKAWTLKYSLYLSFSLIRFWEGRDVCTPVTRPVTTARAPPFLSLCSDGTRVWWWGHFLFLKHSHSWTHSLKITHTNTQTKRWFPECIPHFFSE